MYCCGMEGKNVSRSGNHSYRRKKWRTLPPWHVSIQLNWSSHSEDGGSKVLYNMGQFNHYMVQKPKKRPPSDQQLLNPENLVTCYGLLLAKCAACLSACRGCAVLIAVLLPAPVSLTRNSMIKIQCDVIYLQLLIRWLVEYFMIVHADII